ncbi:hypothetical protein PI125_g27300, partial [Phytophthora idaei]
TKFLTVVSTSRLSKPSTPRSKISTLRLSPFLFSRPRWQRILSHLPLRVIEVGRFRDHGVLHLLANESLDEELSSTELFVSL